MAGILAIEERIVMLKDCVVTRALLWLLLLLLGSANGAAAAPGVSAEVVMMIGALSLHFCCSTNESEVQKRL